MFGVKFSAEKSYITVETRKEFGRWEPVKKIRADRFYFNEDLHKDAIEAFDYAFGHQYSTGDDVLEDVMKYILAVGDYENDPRDNWKITLHIVEEDGNSSSSVEIIYHGKDLYKAFPYMFKPEDGLDYETRARLLRTVEMETVCVGECECKGDEENRAAHVDNLKKAKTKALAAGIERDAVKRAEEAGEREMQKTLAAIDGEKRGKAWGAMNARKAEATFEVLPMVIETAAENATISARRSGTTSHDFDLGVLNGLRIVAELMGMDAATIERAEKAGELDALKRMGDA